MKKKTLALLVTVALVASMTACGGKTEETANTNVNELTVESSVEHTDTPVESQEATEPVETLSAEDAPVATNEIPYSVEFVYCNDDAKNVEYVTSITDSYLLQAIAPYAIITNTSNSTYSIEIEDTIASDSYFEPGEQLRVIAMFSDFEEDDNLELVDMTTAYTLADGEENIIYAWCVSDMDIDEETEEDNYARGMFTITQADITSIEESNEFSYINYNIPAELEGIEGYEIFVIFYNEAETEIGACEGNYRTGTLEYHANVASWTSADIYYRYEVR